MKAKSSPGMIFRTGEAHPEKGFGLQNRQKVKFDMWYVIQTITGKETELVGMIKKLLRGCGYSDCFVIQSECVWRIEGGYAVHMEPLFSSYVFVETDTPEKFFFELKLVPRLAKLLGCDGMFWTVQKEEEELLRRMTGDNMDHIMRRCPVQVDQNGEIVSADGFLKEYVDKIVRKRLRKRRVVIEIPFLGEKKRIQIGVRMDGD